MPSAAPGFCPMPCRTTIRHSRGRRGIPVVTAQIVAIGGAHIDRRGTILGPTHAGASNPGDWREEPGGGVFNAARSLARLGRPVRLIAPRGGDAAGDRVAEAAAAAGVEDTPLTFLDRATPSYTAILEADGNLVVALADMALYDLYGPRQVARRTVRDAITAARAVLTDANLPAATLAALCRACNEANVPVFAIAISPAKVVRLQATCGHLRGLFMNEAEARALSGSKFGGAMEIAAALRKAGLRAGIVTRGAAPAVAFDDEGCWSVAPPSATGVVDVTGAGDALAAGYVDAFLDGASPAESLRRGVAAAGLALASRFAAPPDIDAAALGRALSFVPPAVPLP